MASLAQSPRWLPRALETSQRLRGGLPGPGLSPPTLLLHGSRCATSLAVLLLLALPGTLQPQDLRHSRPDLGQVPLPPAPSQTP